MSIADLVHLLMKETNQAGQAYGKFQNDINTNFQKTIYPADKIKEITLKTKYETLSEITEKVMAVINSPKLIIKVNKD
jgi:hypothetical protein